MTQTDSLPSAPVQPADPASAAAAGRDTAASRIAIIGGGPAGLMAAEILSAAGRGVDVYEALPSAGRKFLMAGRGGLNITHSEPLDRFLSRYGAARPLFERLLARFSPADLRAWCAGLGVPTLVGSSGRVFPEGFKASPLLRAWLARLAAQGVRLFLRHRWSGWDEAGRLCFDTPSGRVEVQPLATVLALGGASWPRLGSDGRWAPLVQARGVGLAPFRPSNSGFDIAWGPGFLERAEGQPLKRIALGFAGRTVPGELVITRSGLEGGALYALSAPVRDALERDGQATVLLDLKPDLSPAQIQNKLARVPAADSLANRLRKALSLTPPVGALLRELCRPEDLVRPAALAARIKAVPLVFTGMRGLDRAISTAGGIRLDELDANLMLRRCPGLFACGEMLDWEAPTGGYLLQGCMASGVGVAEGVLSWLHDH
ncbi:TIGR03862 family flavoprotein [Oleisolibacter albus]|uniref:TIGR03862 family flavoprotein n=1 Tax=Oleisolibacter albus TaxID=2171757 RepID=UPI000DF1A98A|nr:TIGR03862 family flavoprotein [Oleisolibacter albus]